MAPKIFLWVEPTDWRDVLAYAMSEDGHVLGSHLSTNVDFAKHDIGLKSDWHHQQYKEKYPDGFELVWLDDPGSDPGFVEAMRLNQKLYDEQQAVRPDDN